MSELLISLSKVYYDSVPGHANSRKGKYYKTVRQSTVEPVFGTLINFTGMRRINTRGIESANKLMLMAAMAYNLKKLLRYEGKYSDVMASVKAFCRKTDRFLASIVIKPGFILRTV